MTWRDDYRAARDRHIAAAAATAEGRVKRPDGKPTGLRLVFHREPHPTYPWRQRIGWAFIHETRQMRREQERREERQKL